MVGPAWHPRPVFPGHPLQHLYLHEPDKFFVHIDAIPLQRPDDLPGLVCIPRRLKAFLIARFLLIFRTAISATGR